MSSRPNETGNHSLSVELYKILYLARTAEEYIIKHYPDDGMKTPMHMSMGEEAIAVGVCHALGQDNQIWTSYRTHAAFLAKTGDTDKFFAEMYGKVTGTAAGKAGSMHLSDPDKGHITASAIVASVLPPAIGLAFANKSAGNGRISCVFFGDGAMDEGSFWETLNVASLMRLPALFVCEDNGLAVHTPTEVRQGYRSILEQVSGFNCTVLNDDTTDVERVYNLTKEAINTIQSTGGPVFLHLKCYRYLEHVGIAEDFDAGYRPRSEYEEWLKRDCVKLQRERLIEQGMPSEDVLQMESAIEEQIRNSIQLAQDAPFPQPQELYKGVFYEGA
jgi:pyruvate dehydrogenase E1 component alpha subunit